MSMPRSQFQSYGKRGPHHNQRGHPVSSHGHHSQLQRATSSPIQPAAPAPAAPTPVEVYTPPPAAMPMPAAASSASASEGNLQTPANYEQVVRYAKERWLSVKKDLLEPPDDPARRIEYYVERGPNPKQKGFVPIDLEAFFQQQRLKRREKALQQQQQQPPPPPPPPQ